MLIRLKAKTIDTEMKMKEFAGGPSRCLRSMRQTNLSRAQMPLCQQLPPDCEEKFGNFHNFTQAKIAEDLTRWLSYYVIYVEKKKGRGVPLHLCFSPVVLR